jgi:hypothetical protein
VELVNGVDLLVMPASYRTMRGVTAVAVLADEIAYWMNEENSQNPDAEIQRCPPGTGDDTRPFDRH